MLGHSWGTAVAVALALRHPDRVRALVLASGYYYPTRRPDFALLAVPAIPVLGDLQRHTLLPLLTRLLWPLLLRQIFGPDRVPSKFAGFPREMAVRPSQLRAAAEESGLLRPTARALLRHYPHLRQPVVIVAGTDDRLVDTDEQSARLSRQLGRADMRRVAGAGHMVHQTSPDTMMAAIDAADRAASSGAQTLAAG